MKTARRRGSVVVNHGAIKLVQAEENMGKPRKGVAWWLYPDTEFLRIHTGVLRTPHPKNMSWTRYLQVLYPGSLKAGIANPWSGQTQLCLVKSLRSARNETFQPLWVVCYTDDVFSYCCYCCSKYPVWVFLLNRGYSRCLQWKTWLFQNQLLFVYDVQRKRTVAKL